MSEDVPERGPGQGAVFLARRGYRRRRLADASRALPVLGAFLFLLPALGAAEGASGVLVYLFAVWGLLIALAAAMAPRLAAPPQDGTEGGARPPDPR